MEKLIIPYPVLVEGKYDKIKLDSILEARILTTEGFGIFRQKEKAILLRKITQHSPLIVLTDSDGAGLVIRNHINSILPKEKLIHLYTPAIAGKERRKDAPSKAGLLGVEGIEAQQLRELFAPFAASELPLPAITPVTKGDFYAMGLSGGVGSAQKRKRLCTLLEIPQELSANALLDAVNLLGGRALFTPRLQNDLEN